MGLDSSRSQREEAKPSEAGHRSLRQDFPLEEAQKNYHTILEQQTARAEEELKRPALALFLSGLTAGLDVGFGPFAMAVNTTLFKGAVADPFITLLNANLYSIGFVFVVLGYSALFTEQTASAVQPVLSRRANVGSLVRLWGIVLTANILGAAAFSYFAAILGPALEVVDPHVLGEIAHRMVAKPWWVMLLSGVAAGWLMGLLAWLITAARDTTSQLICVWLTTMLIGLSGMHHSIAGTVEILMGLFTGTGVTASGYVTFLVWSVIGNALGGVIFVAGLKYSHIRKSVRD
ncbi:MAG: formate/nitrite transporter FocA (FNT family) [Bacteroidia bacterium]|jgi:formate/nitrite transporter FocA (FNT family)